jgi:hypothetical protein
MAVKPLAPTATSEAVKPDPMAFIEGANKPVRKPARAKSSAPAKDPSSLKSERFFVYMDADLLRRIDKECKRRGGIGRSVLLRLLAAEHLPE